MLYSHFDWPLEVCNVGKLLTWSPRGVLENGVGKWYDEWVEGGGGRRCSVADSTSQRGQAARQTNKPAKQNENKNKTTANRSNNWDLTHILVWQTRIFLKWHLMDGGKFGEGGGVWEKQLQLQVSGILHSLVQVTAASRTNDNNWASKIMYETSWQIKGRGPEKKCKRKAQGNGQWVYTLRGSQF